MVNEESVKFRIEFRFGPAFPAINTEIYCLKRDFLQLLEDITQLDPAYLSMLEPHDPGLCIYHIPHYGEYFFLDTVSFKFLKRRGRKQSNVIN